MHHLLEILTTLWIIAAFAFFGAFIFQKIRNAEKAD